MKAFHFLVFVIFGLSTLAQKPFFSPQELRDLSEDYKSKAARSIDYFRENRKKALELAPEKGWVIVEQLPDGGIRVLVGVDQYQMPVYYETHNLDAAISIGTNHLWPGGISGFSLDGSSQFLTGKLALWDGGIVLNNHVEMEGRVVAEEPGEGISDHATHVAGTMIASGLSPLARGMSYRAQQIRSWNFNDDVPEMSGAANGLIVSNHSYGTVAGWRSSTTTTPNWSWYGNVNVSTVEDFNFGYYDSRAGSYDQMAYYNPYYLIVKSAGNDRTSIGSNVGQPFRRRNAQGQWETLNRPPGMSSNNGYDIISTFGNAKNILTVGAVNDVVGGYYSPSDVSISSFSSWGPTDDGRIKPDIVANGVNLYSASSSLPNAYRVTSGTSMSAPNASGSAFLLQELHHVLNGHFMLSSTLRGLICHTADEAGNPGPDYVYGWGLMNSYSAAKAIANNGVSSLIAEIPLNSSQTITREIIASASEPLVVSITWTDPEAEPIPFGPAMLNNRTPRLINDLDLRVSKEQKDFLPWVLNPDAPMAFATKGVNIVDNMEQVVVENPIPGKTYTITVSHKGTLLRAPQAFSLIATGVLPSPFCNSAPSSNQGGRINGFVLNTINNSTSSGCTTYRDFTNQKTTLQAGQTYSFQVPVGTCSDSNPMIAKIFVDWNNNGTLEENELVATSGILVPENSFDGTITVPYDVNIKGTSLLRIVLVETQNPNEVNACSTYAKGETQDYLVSFSGISKDLSVVSIANLGGQTCATKHNGILVELENRGEEQVLSFIIRAVIKRGQETILSLSQNFTNLINPKKKVVVPLSGFIEFTPNQEYEVEITAVLDGDQNPTNNKLAVSVVASPPGNDPRGALCSGETMVTLYEPNNSNMFWYSDSQAQNLLAVGGRVVLNAMPASGKVFGAPGFLERKVGPATKDSEPWAIGGGYSDFSSGITFFNTMVPLRVNSARLYSEGSGLITIQVENAQTGKIIAIKQISLSNTSVSGTDLGRVYDIGIDIPAPDSYRLRYFISGTRVWRSRDHSFNPYPYTIPGVIEITGTNQSNPTNFYYFLYDIEITAIGCRGGSLSEVDIQVRPKPSVNLAATQQFVNGQLVLDAGNPGSSYLWNTGQTTRTIEPQEPGNYIVMVTNLWGCSAGDQIYVAVTAVSQVDDLPVRIFPNPNTGVFRVETPGVFNVEIYDISGRKIFLANNQEFSSLIDISSFQTGIYIMRLYESLPGRISTHKLVVGR